MQPSERIYDIIRGVAKGCSGLDNVMFIPLVLDIVPESDADPASLRK